MESFERLQGQAEVHFDKEICSAKLATSPPEKQLERVRVVAEQEGLLRKDEFHITLIGRETGERILRKLQELPRDQQESLLIEIDKRLRTFDWQFTLLDEFYTIAKKYHTMAKHDEEIRRTLIQAADVPRLEQFYVDLNTLLGTDFKTPYPHITLYSTSTRPDRVFRGIGIYAKDELHALNPVKVSV
jgi:hypothetical protein